MRFIHTADWHLGRSFYGASLIEDQAYVISQLIDLVRDAKPNALLISGDIYDRAIPPVEAVELLDDTLSQLVLEIELPVILIAGNHDSPQRLQFGARLMRTMQLHVFGTMPNQMRFVQMYDEAGPVCFYALPYTEPSIVREYFENDQIINHETAMRAWTDLIKGQHQSEMRSVLIAHGYVVGGDQCDSERPISVGASGAVGASCFEGFHYVALGHLHRPQTLGDGQIHYSGSLLKYSFSEAAHSKSVNLVEMDATGKCTVERISLRAKHDVRCVEGFLDDLMKEEVNRSNRGDYIQVKLLDKGVVFDAKGKLETVYPNVRDVRTTLLNEVTGQISSTDHRQSDVTLLFEKFFREVTGDEIDEEYRAVFRSVVDKVRQVEREASS